MTDAAPDCSGLPLSALLSQALVAFTIEFDNEAERQIPHRTSDHGGTPGGVWLVSMAMWLNCMRYASEDPVTVGKMRQLARGDTNLHGMQRWGYISIQPGPAGQRGKAAEDGQLVRATRKGLAAKAVWQPLTDVIEQRWRERYGPAELARLARALGTIAGQLESWLPDSLPILGYGLFSAGSKPGENRYLKPQGGDTSIPLPWLLARVLLAFAIEFEMEAKLSLAIAANVLRVVEPSGVTVKDLPVLSGVSVESLAMATGYLEKRGLGVVGAGPAGSKWKVFRPTEAGLATREASQNLVIEIEDRWRDRFGTDVLAAIRLTLEPLAGERLLAATAPFPDGWRASVRRPTTLPHYPMVLHRGGFPDGS